MKNNDQQNSTGNCKNASRGLEDLTVHPVGAMVLRCLEREKRLTLSGLDDQYALRDVSRSAIKYHLRLLLARGYAQRHGRGKGVWYTL